MVIGSLGIVNLHYMTKFAKPAIKTGGVFAPVNKDTIKLCASYQLG
jgi:hypothetical protein